MLTSMCTWYFGGVLNIPSMTSFDVKPAILITAITYCWVCQETSLICQHQCLDFEPQWKSMLLAKHWPLLLTVWCLLYVIALSHTIDVHYWAFLWPYKSVHTLALSLSPHPTKPSQLHQSFSTFLPKRFCTLLTTQPLSDRFSPSCCSACLKSPPMESNMNRLNAFD